MKRSKNSKYLSCGCCIDYTYEFNNNAKGSQYKFGDDDDPPYKKKARRGKYCKKGKGARASHDYSVPFSIWGYRYSYKEKKYLSAELTNYKCSRCGKPSYRSRYQSF